MDVVDGISGFDSVLAAATDDVGAVGPRGAVGHYDDVGRTLTTLDLAAGADCST